MGKKEEKAGGKKRKGAGRVGSVSFVSIYPSYPHAHRLASDLI